MFSLLFFSLLGSFTHAPAQAQLSLIPQVSSSEFIQWNQFNQNLAKNDEVYRYQESTETNFKKVLSSREQFSQDRNQLIEGLERVDWANAPGSGAKELFLSKIIVQNPIKKLKSLRLFFRDHCYFHRTEVDALLVRDQDFICIKISREQSFFLSGWKPIASALFNLTPQESKVFSHEVALLEPSKGLSDESLAKRAFHLASRDSQIFTPDLKCHTLTPDGAVLYRMSDIEWCRGENRLHPDGRVIHRNLDLTVVCSRYVKY